MHAARSTRLACSVSTKKFYSSPGRHRERHDDSNKLQIKAARSQERSFFSQVKLSGRGFFAWC